MKFFFGFLFGLIFGAGALYIYNDRDSRPVAAASSTASDVGSRVRDTAVDARDAIGEKLEAWHLTGDDIKRDLSKTGKVVRTKAAAAGEAVSERISDARVVTIVKAKLVLDRDLSALDINVDCSNGDVVLRGSVASPALIGRAMALALDTTSVRTVTSQLTVTTTK